jgi:hypothetical protein
MQETSRAIKEASERLPCFAKMPFTPTKWQVRAQGAAAEAIARLPNDASYEQKLRVASAAVQPISQEFEDLELKEKILNSLWFWEGTSEDQKNAREAVRKALADVPSGASRPELERVRDQALKPIRAVIEEREAETQKQQRVEQLLRHAANYLNQLERDGEIEFESSLGSYQLADELKPHVRRAILEKLKNSTDLSDRQIESLIEEFIDDHLDESEE